MAEASHSQLVQRVQAGDHAALGRLLELYQQRLYNVCLRMVGNRDDAAELAQEAMLKIVEHIHDYTGQSAISTWMIRICMNLSISHLRKRRLRQTTSLDGNGRPGAGDDQLTALRHQLVDRREPDPRRSVQNREMIERIGQALAHVDEEFRAILVLRDVEEMDYARIASVLSVPVGTVKSRLFRARLALRRRLMSDEGELPLDRPTRQGVRDD